MADNHLFRDLRGGTRRLLSFGLVVAVALLMGVVFTEKAAAAAPNVDSTLIIHKLTQGDSFGPPATGKEQDVPGEPVAGVSFSATAVPDVDITTAAGLSQASEMTVAQAIAAIGADEPAKEGVTNGAGLLALYDLPPALYLVKETGTPTGVVSGMDFLVPLPFPADDCTWLSTVHVYPKNAQASVLLDVNDAATITSSDPVHWTSRTSIALIADPANPPTGNALGLYAVRNVLHPDLRLVGTNPPATVSLSGASAPTLNASDYTISLETVGNSQSILVHFTASGLAKLASARASNPEAEVMVKYTTTVAAGADQSATFTTETLLYAASPSADGSKPPLGEPIARSTQVIKFGDLVVTVHQKDHPNVPIPGARVKLYLSAADALAGRNPIVVSGVDEWTTGADGTFTIKGLGLSNFANGLDRAPCVAGESPCLYRDYYLILSYIPAGWSGEKSPVAVAVTSTASPVEAALALWKKGGTGGGGGSDGDGGGGGLPVTGAQILGAVLLAVVALLLGSGLIKRRRQEKTESGSA